MISTNNRFPLAVIIIVYTTGRLRLAEVGHMVATGEEIQATPRTRKLLDSTSLR